MEFLPDLRAAIHPAAIRWPSQYIYSLAVAPYVTINDNQNVSGLTLDQLFADLNQYLRPTYPVDHVHVALAAQYGVPLMAYEGGQGLIPGGNNEAVMQQAQHDPRMYQLYLEMMQVWQQAGGGLFDAYQLTGGGGQYGFWGMLPDVNVIGSQKYDGLLASAYAPGDANGDGTVNYADFQAVQANYGSTRDWVQGDFNDDGTVNWSDLNLLRQNLNPAGFTLGQFAQQAALRPARHRLHHDRGGIRRLRRDLREQLAAVLDVGDRGPQPDQHGATDRPRRRDLQPRASASPAIPRRPSR